MQGSLFVRSTQKWKKIILKKWKSLNLKHKKRENPKQWRKTYKTPATIENSISETKRGL